MIVLLLLLLLVTPAVAQEARCGVLGAQCICSETFNGITSFTQFPDAGGQDQWNPNGDGNTTKQCTAESRPGVPIIREERPEIWTDATMLSRLPAGHSIVSAVGGSNGHTGRFDAGHGAGGISASFTEIRARWYLYHSPNFAFKVSDTAGQCNNSKWTEHDFDNRVDYTAGFHLYNHLTWSPAVDCCQQGPGPNTGISPSQMQGKWWRFELVVGPRDTSTYQLRMWGRNVTDNGTLLLMIDSRDEANCGGAGCGSMSGIDPPGLMSKIITNNHRFATTTGCTGWRAISHYLMAQFTTTSSAGDRIGAATEIEGGGGGGPNQFTLALANAAYSVTGGIVTLTRTAGPTQIGFIHTAALAVFIVAVIVTLLILRRRRTHVDR